MTVDNFKDILHVDFELEPNRSPHNYRKQYRIRWAGAYLYAVDYDANEGIGVQGHETGTRGDENHTGISRQRAKENGLLELFKNGDADNFGRYDLKRKYLDSMREEAKRAYRMARSKQLDYEIEAMRDKFKDAEAFLVMSPRGFANEISVYAYQDREVAERKKREGNLNGWRKVLGIDALCDKIRAHDDDIDTYQNPAPDYWTEWPKEAA